MVSQIGTKLPFNLKIGWIWRFKTDDARTAFSTADLDNRGKILGQPASNNDTSVLAKICNSLSSYVVMVLIQKP